MTEKRVTLFPSFSNFSISWKTCARVLRYENQPRKGSRGRAYLCGHALATPVYTIIGALGLIGLWEHYMECRSSRVDG